MSWWTSHRGTVLGAIAGAASIFVPALAPYAASLIGGGASLGGALGNTPESQPYGPTQDGGNLAATQLPTVTTTASPQGTNWGSVIGGLGSAAASVIGGNQANAANAKQAQAQMDFQASQTGTSYQRGVADMKAAGLNPMLAYSQGGASSGAGASAHIGDALSPGVSSAMNGLQTMAGLGLTKSQIEKTNAETDWTASQTAMQDIRTAQIAQQIRASQTGAKNVATQTEEIESRIPGVRAGSQVATGSVGDRLATISAERRTAESEAVLRGLGVKRGEVMNRGAGILDKGISGIESGAKWLGENAAKTQLWLTDHTGSSAQSFLRGN